MATVVATGQTPVGASPFANLGQGLSGVADVITGRREKNALEEARQLLAQAGGDPKKMAQVFSNNPEIFSALSGPDFDRLAKELESTRSNALSGRDVSTRESNAASLATRRTAQTQQGQTTAMQNTATVNVIDEAGNKTLAEINIKPDGGIDVITPSGLRPLNEAFPGSVSIEPVDTTIGVESIGQPVIGIIDGKEVFIQTSSRGGVRALPQIGGETVSPRPRRQTDIERLVDALVNTGKSKAEATKLAGNVIFEGVDPFGRPILIDKSNPTAPPVLIDRGTPIPGVTPLTDKKAKFLADKNVDITRILDIGSRLQVQEVLQASGFRGGFAALTDNTIGQLSSTVGNFFASNQSARNELRRFNQAVKVTFTNNPRFPIAEQETVLNFLSDPDKLFQNPEQTGRNYLALLRDLEQRFQFNNKLLGQGSASLADRQFKDGQIIVNKQTGERRRFNAETQAFEPVGSR